MDQTLAEASHHVMDQAKQVLSKIPQAVQQAQALLHQLTPPPQDPAGQTALAVADKNNQGKVQAIQAQGQQKTQQTQAESQAKMQQTVLEQQGDDQRSQAEIQAKEQISQRDNTTALEISAAKIGLGILPAYLTAAALGTVGLNDSSA